MAATRAPAFRIAITGTNDCLWMTPPGTSYYSILSLPSNADRHLLYQTYRQWQLTKRLQRLSPSNYTILEKIFETLTTPALKCAYDNSLLVPSPFLNSTKAPSPLSPSTDVPTPLGLSASDITTPTPTPTPIILGVSLTLAQACMGHDATVLHPQTAAPIHFKFLPGTTNGYTTPEIEGVRVTAVVCNSDQLQWVGDDLWYTPTPEQLLPGAPPTLIVHPSGKTIRVKSLDLVRDEVYRIPGFGMNASGDLCIKLPPNRTYVR